ncbi:MAG TPA: hydrogenase subunit MbhD domain-containing protein [Chloroflexota bacterium]|nr:hydrogenase subunit MbhD domain-containing protein [Chloroflexota bacterium]
MTDALQAATLVLAAAGGLAVVITRDVVRQALMMSLFGLLLAILFFAFQAPDVALSEIAVGTIVIPVLLLFTIAKVRNQEKER